MKRFKLHQEPQVPPKLDIDDAFDDYMRAVNPEVAAHSVQYRESRRAFFAGSAALYYHLLVLAGYPEVAAMAEMKQIDEQLENFKTCVTQEKD
jgi:hypothetical protein